MNAGKIRAHVRAWREANPNAFKEYQKKNLAKWRVYNNKRRMAKKEGTLTDSEWLAILEKFSGRCAYCGSTDRVEMDHYIPISKLGRHDSDNIVPICFLCNRRKKDKRPADHPEWQLAF